ncbi:MAG: methyltransferase domain-containing protein [Chloroflexi bacterium]|nr:methyltransferase domain-containing protein [Chloroflexota bacterium]
MDPETRLSPEQLAPLDQFHTDALFATRSLTELVEIDRSTRILDVGAGLGGPARYLASTFGCTVTCLDPVLDFCDAAAMLSEMTGLSGLVSAVPGSALDIPFEDGSYDLVWTQNATMNIEDKARLFSEIRRVLSSGGRYAFQEIAAGSRQPIHLPVPWASSEEMNFLSSAEETRRIAEHAGFEVVVLDENPPVPPTTDPTAAPNSLSFAVFLPNMAERMANSQRNIAEDRTRRLRGVLRAA